MATPLRHNQPNADYHVYNRGPNGEVIVRDHTDRRIWLRTLVRTASRHPIEILAFCLMGNHYHLMVRCLEACLSNFMRDLGSAYSCYYNARHQVEGRLCRDRFQSKHVDSAAYFRALSFYIHRNPKDLGFDGRLAEYPWSSLGYYLSPHDAPWWLNPDPVLIETGGATNYAAEVDGDDRLGVSCDAGPDELYQAWAVRRVDEILATVCMLAGLEAASSCPESAMPADVRGVALLLARELTDVTASDISVRLGYSSGASLRNAAWRYRERLKHNDDLAELFHAARAELG